MAGHDPQSDPTSRGALPALGIAVFAGACCAALPFIAALAGGIAAATLLGTGAGLAVAAVLASLVVARARRRRAGPKELRRRRSHGLGRNG